MKKSIFISIILVLVLAFSAVAAPDATKIRLSTTTSVNDSGLLPGLQKIFEAKNDYTVDIVSNGTGAAIKLGESGDADLLLVHAKASEEAFIEGGHGVERIPFMHNFFVIVGPATDPAGVKNAATAADAYKAIADAKAPFVSRGDDSGTHKAELKIWKGLDIDPTGKDWYISAGAGMGATLTQANERLAYTFTDKATFLSMADKLELEIVLEQSPDLKNVYSLIAVSPEKHPDVNAKGAEAFIEFMLSDEASDYIAHYGEKEFGQALFFLGDGSPKKNAEPTATAVK